MIISPGFIGIDVSKDHLDIFDGSARQIANSAEAIAAYLGGLSAPQLVLLEATGHYDRELRRQMQAAGMRFARVNPARARAFAHATGRLAKTDAIDAQLLAAMAQALNPAPHEPADQERQNLADLHRRRAQMVAARQQERTRLPTASALIVPQYRQSYRLARSENRGPRHQHQRADRSLRGAQAGRPAAALDPRHWTGGRNRASRPDA